MISFRRFHPSSDLGQSRRAVNMHIHTAYSDDASGSVDRLITEARKRQIGLAITDHNTIDGALEASIATDVLVIPGVEVTAGPGIHLLLYFDTFEKLKAFNADFIEPHRGSNPFILDCSVEAVIEQGQNLGATIVLPHPYKTTQGGIRRYCTDKKAEQRILGAVHGIEVLNAMTDARKNDEALSWAKRSMKVVTAGSDGHSPHAVDRAVTIARADTPAAFLAAVRAGHVDLIGTPFRFPYVPYLRVKKELALLFRPGGLRILKDQIRYNLLHR